MTTNTTQSEWKVEGTGATTKIKVECPLCHTGKTFHGIQVDEFARLRFTHNGCKGIAERIPTDIRDEYWQRTVVSQF